uniref:Putative secreted peptide n=1 Tax=Triatoma infestans TaxID=30076 RepID=A0A023FAM1_TRIIF
MKLNISILSVALIAVFLTVCMFDFGEACSFTCTNTGTPVCGTQGGNQRTFNNYCQLDLENDCGRSGGGWTVKHGGACQ